MIKRKRKIKSRNIRNEHKQKEALNNHISYRIRDVFLIMICLCESALFPIILLYGYTSYNVRLQYFIDKRDFVHKLRSHIFEHLQNSDYVFSFSDGFYLSLFHFDLRLLRVLIIVTFYSLIMFVRILTQFLVRKYSFYKYNLNLKTKLSISLYFLLILFISGLIRMFMVPFYFTIAFATLFEFLLLTKVTRQLR